VTARVLDGKRLAAEIRAEIAEEVQQFRLATGRAPHLAAVLVGDNPASQIYVRNKRAACEKAEVASSLLHLPPTTTQGKLLNCIETLNSDSNIDGILVQLPLPEHVDEHAIIESIDPNKDVDGLHPINLGLLASGRPRFVPCTPAGVQEILTRSQIDTCGAHVVIVGRSSLVGRPLALLLSQKSASADATVTICHSRTRNLAEHVRRADILVAAIGRPEFITGEMIRPGATVIDVGINRLDDGRIVGDVQFAGAAQIAGAITAVPGGVGPMTIALLLQNTLRAAKRRLRAR
jgi:methylenetetrahydrofolate dehydrogenase (NADP+)/methenyltetrahydrofolate cyclohydrolase